MKFRSFTLSLPIISLLTAPALGQQITQERLDALFLRYPDADLNGDARLSLEEAKEYRNRLRSGKKTGGTYSATNPHPGWSEVVFPEHAICYKTPEEIRAIYAKQVGEQSAVASYDKPTDGSLRIIGTGHSFMVPGYRILENIASATKSQQKLYTHTSGGETGSTRYKWEQENGIFRFDQSPKPKLLASLSNAEWDVMTWGPYTNDQPRDYSCWIDFALRYQPNMKFYLMDSWPQLSQYPTKPVKDADITSELIGQVNAATNTKFAEMVRELRGKYGDRIFIIPTNDAFTSLAQLHLKTPLPGIDGLYRSLCHEETAIWRDTLGHISHSYETFEGYVFYATLYGKNPLDLPAISPSSRLKDSSKAPSPELDEIFRKLAWEAVTGHPLSGVKKN